MLNKTETAAMRGIAILAIVLHNYTHWLGPMVKENEYTFVEHNVRRLLVELSHPSWELIAHLLSFFGHYGVPVFVFLSAFGLVMKYERSGKGDDGGAMNFLYNHWKKLFMMMVVGYSAFVLVDYMTPGPRRYEFWNVVGQLGMFNNLYADPDKDIWPGPYWYFGLTLQLYIIYRLVLYPGRQSLAGKVSLLRNRYVLAVVALVFMFAQLAFDEEGNALNWYRYNCMGHLPVFILGVLWTRYGYTHLPESKVSLAVVTLLLSLFIVVFSMEYVCWMLVPVIVVVATVTLVKMLPEKIMAAMAWVGGISSAMFVLHPITRKVIIPVSRHGELFAGLLLYLVATIVIAMLKDKKKERKVSEEDYTMAKL